MRRIERNLGPLSRRLGLGLGCLALLPGCAWLLLGKSEAAPAASPPPQATTRQPVTIGPLPGALDERSMFNSNSPEIVQEEGILLSTFAPEGPQQLGWSFNGPFEVFSHHIAKDAEPDAHRLYLGTLARNAGSAPVTLRLLHGSSYQSQPDAPFIGMPPLQPDEDGRLYAGPGDRVAVDWLHGRSSLNPHTWVLQPGEVKLITSFAIPTEVPIPPPINGRTTRLSMESDGPIQLAEVARFAQRGSDGAYLPPSQADYEETLGLGRLAGPRENAATAYDPLQSPRPSAFRYGRVAGVSRGGAWQGTLDADALAALAPGESLGYPVAALYLNRWGSGQDQSALLVRRYADTAYAAHGNYGVTYELAVPLSNPSDEPRSYALTFSHPARVEGDRPARAAFYLEPPNRPVMFRGPLRLRWTDAQGKPQERFVHAVLRHGERQEPFATIRLGPREAQRLDLAIHYPADATPPQLLTITREGASSPSPSASAR